MADKASLEVMVWPSGGMLGFWLKPAEGRTCNANAMVLSIVVMVPSPVRRNHSLLIPQAWRKDSFQSRPLLRSLNEVAVYFSVALPIGTVD